MPCISARRSHFHVGLQIILLIHRSPLHFEDCEFVERGRHARCRSACVRFPTVEVSERRTLWEIHVERAYLPRIIQLYICNMHM